MARKTKKERREERAKRAQDLLNVVDEGGKNPRYRGLKPNLNGRPPAERSFTEALRLELTKRKRFRRPDGSLMESSELELIALKVIRELRIGTPISSKLLEIILNRIEGKPKEMVELDATLEVSSGIDAKDILLQRLNRILSAGEGEGSDTPDES